MTKNENLKYMITNVFELAASVLESAELRQNDSEFAQHEIKETLSNRFSAYAMIKDNPLADDVLETLMIGLEKDGDKDGIDPEDYLNDSLEIFTSTNRSEVYTHANLIMDTFSAYINLGRTPGYYN